MPIKKPFPVPAGRAPEVHTDRRGYLRMSLQATRGEIAELRAIAVEAHTSVSHQARLWASQGCPKISDDYDCERVRTIWVHIPKERT